MHLFVLTTLSCYIRNHQLFQVFKVVLLDLRRLVGDIPAHSHTEHVWPWNAPEQSTEWLVGYHGWESWRYEQYVHHPFSRVRGRRERPKVSSVDLFCRLGPEVLANLYACLRIYLILSVDSPVATWRKIEWESCIATWTSLRSFWVRAVNDHLQACGT